MNLDGYNYLKEHFGYYNAKVIKFDNYIEIVRYHHGNIRFHEQSDTVKGSELDSKEKKIKVRYQSAQRAKRKIRYYILANDFNLFWTLTFDDKKVNAKNYEYAIKSLKAWLKYMREKFGKFDFIFVPELHKSGRIHFHGLTREFAPPLTRALNPKTGRLIKEKGRQIYNAPVWNKGFSTVSYIHSKKKTASYITKYISKALIESPIGFHQPKYFPSRGLKLPSISYEDLPDEYFATFKPSLVVGEQVPLEPVSPSLSIYNLDIDKEGTLSQFHWEKTDYILNNKKPLPKTLHGQGNGFNPRSADKKPTDLSILTENERNNHDNNNL